MGDDIEFWRLETVIAKTGYSKTEIYRRMKEGAFPRSHSYNDGTAKRFWLSTEIRRWQAEILSRSGAT